MEMVQYDHAAMRKKAEEIRYNLVAMMDYAGSGHPGGSLSVVEIMTELYYGDFLKADPKNPQNPKRNRLVMSKGHAGPTLYVILADLGFYPQEKLRVFDKNNSMLPKHCNRKLTPGVDASTGALGQGMSVAVGMACVGKQEGFNVYCILGDGECQSGEIWEGAMSAAAFGLNNLKVIVDNNRLQIDGFSADIMPLGDQEAKWKAFGWHVVTVDGHDLNAIHQGLLEMETVTDRPAVMIANTVKGKGVSFMEDIADWHSRKMTPEEGIQALGEISENYKALGYGNVEESIMFLSQSELAELTGKGGC